MSSVAVLVVKEPGLWFNPDKIEGVGIRVGFVGPELVIVLPQSDVVIGRGRRREGDAGFVTLTLALSSVSRRHCALRYTDPGYEIEDLKSACGTPVNDRKIQGRVRLQPGDRIHIGGHLFIFDETPSIELADEPWVGPYPTNKM